MVDPANYLSIDFGRAGNGAAYAVSGWSIPEEAETWSVGPVSLLRVPAPRRPATYVLVLKLRPHVGGALTAQRLRVVANGTQIGQFTIARRTIRACLIPWQRIVGRDALEIAFETPDAGRPSDSGGSPDRRQLGIAITSMTLEPDRYEAWQTDSRLLSDEPVAVDIATISPVEAMTLQQLMLQFESLGQNCEFGLVQRKAGAEPLGLLRFASAPLPNLLAALEARFDGMGVAENVRASVSPNGRELMVHDDRFGFLYHAWVNAGEMTIEEVRHREIRRVPFLIRKLLEDLEAGEKIFVFKGMAAMNEEEVFPLAIAIRRFGPNTLLFVNLADANHRAGTVEARAPGFLIGYIDRFAPSEDAQDFLHDQWVRLCRETYRYRLAAAATSGG